MFIGFQNAKCYWLNIVGVAGQEMGKGSRAAGQAAALQMLIWNNVHLTSPFYKTCLLLGAQPFIWDAFDLDFIQINQLKKITFIISNLLSVINKASYWQIIAHLYTFTQKRV